ncbi:putative zinc protease [Nocardioides baekrokdamisoli]|uniref:Putative zinc protease n=2 Tax=Nocardioides baekrokdamisoli TaxID=1804624 RepID=A0A3G9IGS1_9ACTN|nr:putative zinc protease [Nocardioides baekrokdamisoli]
MSGVRSAAVGVWVGVGSRDETPEQHGCSHFLEHLLFKGTPSRTALDISVALDSVGGEFNAYTAKEYTVFHARILDRDLPMAIDVLGDMISSSLITSDDVEAEREVILDEIAMHDDDADDVVHNLFAAQAYGADTPLGRGIAGTFDSIRGMSRETIADFYRARYRPENMVVAAAGNLDHDEVVRQVEAAFGRQGFLDTVADPIAPRAGTPLPVASGTVTETRAFEQANVVLGVPGFGRDDERRFALSIVNATLGGGTSSRLFQEVREKRGLAYSVYSFVSGHADTGVIGVAVGCLPEKTEETLATVRAELAKLAAHGITADELRLAKGQLAGGVVLGLEDSASRMSRLGKAELVHDQMLTIDDVLHRMDAVTLEECREVARLYGGPEILAIVGP